MRPTPAPAGKVSGGPTWTGEFQPPVPATDAIQSGLVMQQSRSTLLRDAANLHVARPNQQALV